MSKVSISGVNRFFKEEKIVPPEFTYKNSTTDGIKLSHTQFWNLNTILIMCIFYHTKYTIYTYKGHNHDLY